ncbi:MAG TPA: hypothetical protein VM284_05075 [Candidatus Limnocylindria bacterium]|nr:hypothetical protein [Candidatus Limnocylindria bacterium]
MAALIDHDAVRDWIDDAFLTPGMRDGDDTTARAVRAHLAACADCGAYDDETRRAALKLDLARGPSPEVRTRTLAAAQRLARARTGATAPPGTRPGFNRGLTWRLAALGLVIAIVGAGAGAWWSGRHDSDVDHLSDAVAMMATLATNSGAHEVVLRDGAGNGEGIAMLSPSTRQLSMFATHLPAGVEYHCYLERNGQRTWIGSMYADGGVQFWAGDMDARVDMQPGDVLVVAADETGPAALTATL